MLEFLMNQVVGVNIVTSEIITSVVPKRVLVAGIMGYMKGYKKLMCKVLGGDGLMESAFEDAGWFMGEINLEMMEGYFHHSPCWAKPATKRMFTRASVAMAAMKQAEKNTVLPFIGDHAMEHYLKSWVNAI